MKSEMIKENIEDLRHHVAELASCENQQDKLSHASIIGCIIESIEEDISLLEIERDNAKRGLRLRDLDDELHSNLGIK